MNKKLFSSFLFLLIFLQLFAVCNAELINDGEELRYEQKTGEHYTCSEYFNFLISNGWKIIEESEDGLNVKLVSPSNDQYKSIYLVNDTSTYDVDNVDSQAYYYTSESSLTTFPSSSGTEFTSTGYSKVSDGLTSTNYEISGTGGSSTYCWAVMDTTDRKSVV